MVDTNADAGSESLTHPISVRLTVLAKIELENAAWIEDRNVAELIKDGIELVLRPIRAKHGGTIPSRPRNKPAEPAVAPSKRGRGK
jgi:hypothetical protein